MRFQILSLLLPIAVASTVLETLTKNGILYEEIAPGRLIQQANSCRPWTMNLNKYADSISNIYMSGFAKSVMKSQFYQSMANVCNAFNVTTDVTQMPMIMSTTHSALRLMDKSGIHWNVMKFERDLKSMMLHHSLPEDFFNVVTESDLTPFSAANATEFSTSTRMMPIKCNVGQLFIEMSVCMKNHPATEGTVYSTVHKGQFSNEEQAFVYYDIPSHILVSNETVSLIDMNKCKTIMGNFVYCFEQETSKCSILTLANCNLMAIRAGEDFLFERNLGRQTLIATTMEELPTYGNDTTPLAVTNHIFMATVNQLNGDSIEVNTQEIDLVEVQLPSIHGDTLTLLSETPIQLLQVSRKGVSYLSNKPIKSNTWQDFKSFFVELF